MLLNISKDNKTNNIRGAESFLIHEQ